MIIKPTSDNIIIKIEEKEKVKKTESGIIIPQQHTEQTKRKDIGTVVAVGEGRMLNTGTVLPMSVNVGDTVLFNIFSGTEIVLENEKYLLLKDSDILAIIEK